MRLTKILLPLFVGFIITAQGFAAELTSMHKILPEYREKAATFLFHMENEADVEAFMKAPVQSFPNITPEVIHADNVELRIYRPKNTESGTALPVIYYSHGGGYLLRGAYNNMPKYQMMADRMNVAVVTPKYRTSMEASFPAALEDAYKGVKFVKTSGANYGLNTDKIIIMGDSAGGGLTAALALYNRDHDNLKLNGQILIYPMLDSRTGSKDDIYNAPYTGQVCWDRETNAFAWKKLAGYKKIPKKMRQYYSPAFAKNLKDLPPAMIYVGDLDLFVNEDISYGNKLISQGIDTEMHVIPGVYHGFDAAVPNAKATIDFWNTVAYKVDCFMNR